MIKIGAIHSGSANMAPILEKALAPRFEEFEILNVIDDTLIKTVIRDQTLTTRTVKRVADLSEALILAGADVVVDTCSSIGEAAEIADSLLEKPVQRIDQAMIDDAVGRYNRIGVLASLSTTLDPTVRCVERTAQRLGRPVTVYSQVAKGAFEKWAAGEPEAHDALLIEAARSLTEAEVILLAQVSMVRVQDRMARETGKPIFSSPEHWAEHLRAAFEHGDL